MISQRGRLWSLLIDNSLLLIAGTVAGLAWANVDRASYARFSHTVHFAVNDVGMVFFFALAVKEIVKHPGLRLVDLHCHIGSQIMDEGSFQAAARVMMQFYARAKHEFGAPQHPGREFFKALDPNPPGGRLRPGGHRFDEGQGKVSQMRKVLPVALQVSNAR